jgi:hypothetical protein
MLIPSSQRLFSPYVQTEIGRRQGGKGSGLGLALVRQIVRLSNGRLGVDSEYGKGSVFWFELPYAIPPASSRSANKARTNVNSGSSPNPNSHPSRTPGLPSVMSVPTIDEESLNMTSPALEKDDPLEAIEYRESVLSPPSSHTHGNGNGEGRPRMSETESTIPLLSRTMTDDTRRPSGQSPLCYPSLTSLHILISSPNGASHCNDLPAPRLWILDRLIIRPTYCNGARCYYE